MPAMKSLETETGRRRKLANMEDENWKRNVGMFRGTKSCVYVWGVEEVYVFLKVGGRRKRGRQGQRGGAQGGFTNVD